MQRRKFEESVFKGLMIASVRIVVAVLAAILLVIALRGASSLSLSMLIETPKGVITSGKGEGSQTRLWDPSIFHSAHPFFRSC